MGAFPTDIQQTPSQQTLLGFSPLTPSLPTTEPSVQPPTYQSMYGFAETPQFPPPSPPEETSLFPPQPSSTPIVEPSPYPSYKIEEEEPEPIDEGDFFEEIEEPPVPTSEPAPPPMGDIMAGAFDKISKGEIFEGQPPVTYEGVHDSIMDMLPWWGWAIIFFLLGAAFVAILYALFAPEEPRPPTPTPSPTPLPPVPAPPKPAPVPPLDPTRRIYCLIGEDSGRKVVIRVTDPSLCRKTIELTDEEYENSL
jgi:hypothetical protein